MTAAHLLGATAAMAFAMPGETAPRLNPIFGDHAVLQRGPALRIFGTADPGESLIVRLGNAQRTARADRSGQWLVELASPEGSEPLDLTVSGKGGTSAHATDLLVGDVWLCSGQSNMELPAIDLGDRLELHAAQKQAVGLRLAHAAEAVQRGQAASASGPLAEAAYAGPDGLSVRFANVKGRLQSLSGSPLGFELCAVNQASCRFARATINGTSVQLAGDGRPLTRVRYAWADAPVVNLYDESGLPVSSFELPVTNAR